MIDPNEMWVGDLLQVIPTGIVGKYESHRGDIVTLNCKGTKVVANKTDIRTWKQPKVTQELTFDDELAPQNDKGGKLQETIDLHINILAPHMQHQSQARILDFQIEKAREFVQTALDNKRFNLLIIHGKGTGVLKAEIQHMLKDFNKVRYTFDKNKGGATEVWLDI